MNLLASRKRLLRRMNMLDYFLWSYGGYLTVSALCDLCGIILNEKNSREFVTNCIESMYNTLKTNISIDGTNYILTLNDNLMSEFILFYLNEQYEIGNSYAHSLEEYKAKHEKEAGRIIVYSSIVNIKIKWWKEDITIYISDGNIESLPSGVSVDFKIQYLFKEGDQCTTFTGGWQDYYNSGAKITSTTIYLSQNKIGNMYAGTINSIDFSKYNRMYIDLESTDRVYIYTATQQSGYVYNPVYEGTGRKIVSFDLQDFPTFRQTKKLYCMIYSVCTAKIYNIWLE